MSEREQILVESEDAFKAFIKQNCKRYSCFTKSVNRSIESCVVRGPFDIRKKINFKLRNQTIKFENIVFYETIGFTKSNNSKVIFNGCVFHKFLCFDMIQVEFINCTFDFSEKPYAKDIKFYHGSVATMNNCEFINLQRDFKPSDKLCSGSIFCLSPTRLEFNNCKFQNCKNILDLNICGDNVLFKECRFDMSSFFTSDENVHMKDIYTRFNQCTIIDSELTVLKVKEDCCLAWNGEDVYETSATFIDTVHSLPLIGSE